MDILTFNLARNWKRDLEDEDVGGYGLKPKYIRWAKLYLRKAIESVLYGAAPPIVSSEEFRWIRLVCDFVVLDGREIGGEKTRYKPVLLKGAVNTHILRLVKDE
jgi:hypothetical protein